MNFTNAQQSPYEFYGSTLCVRKPFLTDEARLITQHQYSHLVDRGHFFIIRPGKGKGNYALIDFASMRQDIKEQVVSIEKPITALPNPIKDLIQPDNAAIHYFARIKKANGRALEFEKQQIYCTNAIILNACLAYVKLNFRMKTMKVWEKLSGYVNELEGLKYDLPATPKSLRRKFDQYMEQGYKAICHGGLQNENSRKVDENLENLILSIYAMKNKPFATSVADLYLQFLGGAIQVVDMKTGELYDPKEFFKDGKPITVSESTVWNYLNDPKNRILVDKFRSGSLEFNNTHRPHHHRHKPQYSLSKISLDDRDLPRKMADGKRVKAYYAYDVTSGAVIGASYSRDKDTKLFLDCIRDMLQLLQNKDLGIPMEMEVEHHLVNQFKNDLMKAGVAFPFVRWCNAGNSQEKHAEHFNKSKKYGYEKRYQEGIGRWYAKSEAHRTIVEKVFDAENNNYKHAKHQFDELVADDRETVVAYNNGMHPDQKKYKGLTRLQVLEQNVNPKVAHFDEVIWARYVGQKTATSIRRSQYVIVQHAKYQLPSPQVLESLDPNNYEVDAYYLPAKDGNISEVFIYQNDEFICQCAKIETYNTATAEHTSNDHRAIGFQSRYVNEFDNMRKAGTERMAKIKIIENQPAALLPEPEIHHPPIVDEQNEFDILLASYDEEEIKRQAKNRI
jgi:hypothetical protein